MAEWREQHDAEPNSRTDSDIVTEVSQADAETRADESPLPSFWDAIRRLPRYAQVAAAMMADERVPRSAKVALGAGGLYLVSPIDLVPGVIPVAGQLDDLYVMLRALRRALHGSPAEVSAGHLHRFDLTMADVETDIRAVQATAGWLLAKGVQAGSRLAAGGFRRLRRVLGRS